MANTSEKILMDASQLEAVLQRLASQVAERQGSDGAYKIVGIHTRGVPIARRLAALLKSPEPIGILDINLYRDDLSTVADMPVVKETVLPFPVDGARVLLVDDVLYTGRTVRAALDALFDLGRPKKVELLALVDRGGREIPLQADLCGKTLQVPDDEVVKVRLKETDGQDQVVIAKL
ncbi:bifunctional pyr operon transcriptional regulator/uracil phosphoribosyltransferase PyrR [Deltaproteobacteria bacterium PRO3]|nr:bifunctional pyr operon transcriptional regulator/uracil phosphoribosyltransferase PyrR [Deltaproteobacteria bacterium PRO3]